jgi:hypothetical protein
VNRHLALLIAWLLGANAPAFADPAYLPPFLDRVPSVGDRWIYAPQPTGPFPVAGIHAVQVVEAAASPDGWRYVVEAQYQFPPWLPVAVEAVRTEWFLRADGSLWRGGAWINGVLWADPRKPLAVIRELPGPQERTRFGYLGRRPSGPILSGPVGTSIPAKLVRKRGWIYGMEPQTGSPATASYTVELAALPPGSVGVRFEDDDLRRPTLQVRYDDVLGRIGWDWIDVSHSWTLESARIDGETYEP